MSSPILKNKTVSKVIILTLIMGFAIPTAAFAETQAEFDVRKAEAIAAAQARIKAAAENITIAIWEYVKAAQAGLKAKEEWENAFFGKLYLWKKALAAQKAYEKALDNLKDAYDELIDAFAALAAAMAMEWTGC